MNNTGKLADCSAAQVWSWVVDPDSVSINYSIAPPIADIVTYAADPTNSIYTTFICDRGILSTEWLDHTTLLPNTNGTAEDVASQVICIAAEGYLVSS